MATLEERISALEERIAGYEQEYADASTSEERKELRPLITARTNILHALLQQQQQQQAQASGGGQGQGLVNECVFHCAELRMIGSKVVTGVRAEVYSVASKHGGFYNNSKEESIYYCGDDLVVKILFESCTECSQFVNELDSHLRYFPLLQEVQITEPFKSVTATLPLTPVLQRHYKSKDESSEECSIAITRCTHITSKTSIDFETELMMIEDPNNEDFYALHCYNCHLMSQADYPEEKDNPNNSLWMSWPTHQRFDGLHTINEHRVPQFAISFVRRSNEIQTFDYFERERVDIAVECADDGILGVLRNRIKNGMTVDEENKKIYTHVYVEDAEDFQRCLTHKYNETKFIWTKKCHGELVTEEEAHNLRRSARLQANREAHEKKLGVYKK